ncbi:MAG: ABC transporter substrate-binding protein, partial [Pseudomonadota bacterium]
SGEIDYIESPPHDLHPLMKSDTKISNTNWNPAGNQYTFRYNVLHPPFDNPKIRQALLYALNQEDFVKAVVGSEEYYKLCKALFVCGMPFETDVGMDGLLESNFKKARELLKEAGYDGTPIVLMHSTDLYVLTNLAPVAKSLMERVGFKVDMQSMDWQTLVARRSKKDKPSEGGWNAFITSWTAGDLFNPIAHAFLNAGCDKALFGWPCDQKIQDLRDQFAKAADPAKQKEIVAAIQRRWVEYPTHVHLGQCTTWASTAPTSPGLSRRVFRSSGTSRRRAERRFRPSQSLSPLAGEGNALGTHGPLHSPARSRHHPGDVDRRRVRLLDAAADPGRSGRDHRW